MQGFKQFFETRPVSKSLLLLGIVLGAVGYALGLDGLAVAAAFLFVGGVLVAIFTDG
jgi:hypothetical protein